MATRKTKSALDIMRQGSRLNKILYHQSANMGDRYRKVSEITNRYLDNIAKRNGYKGFVDQFKNNRENTSMLESKAFNKQYSRGSYANGVG